MTNVCLSNGSSLPACSVQQKWRAIRWCQGKSLFTELSCFLLSDDLSICIPGNSIFTRCAPTACCCFSLQCSCGFFFLLLAIPASFPFPPESSWKIIPNVSPRLWCSSCFTLWSIYLQRHCAAATATARLLKERCVRTFKLSRLADACVLLSCRWAPVVHWRIRSRWQQSEVSGATSTSWEHQPKWGHHIRSFRMLVSVIAVVISSHLARVLRDQSRRSNTQ